MQVHISSNNDSYIHRVIKKYGRENFEFKILFARESSFIDTAEVIAIKYYNSISPNGYNLQSGGQATKFLHETTKEKLRACNIGKKLSAETREKIAKSNKGRKVSDVTRKKIGDANRNNPNPFKGKTKDPSIGRKISKALKGKKRRPASPETRAKLSALRTGKKLPPLSAEHKKALSERYKGIAFFKGKKHTEETRKKMSLSAKNRHTKKHGLTLEFNFELVECR